MRIAMIGLGKMGYNMTLRLMGGGHEVVVVDKNLDVARELASKGAIFAQTNVEAIAKLAAPRVVWVMVPAALTEEVIAEVSQRLSKGDVIIDGGNSNLKDSRLRAETLAKKGISLLRRRHERRRLGPQERLLPDGRRRQRARDDLRADLQDARADGRLRALRARRARALRQDGPQRHRVRA